MDWVEVALRVDADLSEVVADIMSDFGYQGVALEREGIQPDRWDEATLPEPSHYVVRAYLPQDDQLDTARAKLEQALRTHPVETPLFRNVAEEDWAEAWKRHYHPLRVGERIVVRPAWETADDLRPDDIEIVLDPGMAFGTGTHPTTQLCLRAVEEKLRPGETVLDLGCGSAILSIAAAKLGAGPIDAIDIDPVAIEAAAENIAANDTAENITLATGGLDAALAVGKQYDFVIVNILARIIVEMCAQGLGNLVKPGGRAIFSGAIETQRDELETALRRTGLAPVRHTQQGDWVLVEAEKPIC
jgi:ribosomal protein L11 methyltransferase